MSAVSHGLVADQIDEARSSESAVKLLPHMPQLDGLRTLAVAGVLIHHYTSDGWPTGANMGVKLFFVLSGFLITGILVRSRDALRVTGQSATSDLWRFYMRRFLRIFPLYYLVVAIAFALNLDTVREHIVWLLTYTLNIRMAQQGWFIAHLAHFWTLAVEEQFYIFWPWIVLFAPRRSLIWWAAAMVAIGTGYRLYHVIMWNFFDSHLDGLRTYIFTITCFDTLGMGALLAIVCHENPILSVRKLLARVVLPISATVFVALEFLNSDDLSLIFGDLVLALLFSCLICAAAIGFSGLPQRVLEASPLTYLGRISYGLYVYHPLMPNLLAYLLRQWGYELPEKGFLPFLLATMATVLVASLSWHLFESPINRLKRFFQ